MGDQRVERTAHTHRTRQTQNKRTHTTMFRMEFEPTIPVFKRVKMIKALDRVATAID
jgi:hypothetical protein